MANASFHAMFQDIADNEFDLEIDAPQNGQNLGAPGQALPSPILVLSRYSALIETVRKAAPRGVPVVQAYDLDRAAEKMPSLRPGVLVADTASSPDIAAMVAQLTQQFPDLVVVVAGQREDSATLAQITTSAQFFRFLLVPLSHGQTRATLEAAIAQHKKLSAPPPRVEVRSAPPAREKKSYVTGQVAFAAGIGAGLAVLLGAVWWFASRIESEPEMPVAEVAKPTVKPTAQPTPVATNQPDPLRAELNRAQEAFDRGAYIEPAGNSALDYYRSALNIDSDSSAAKDGIRNVADRVLERVETALSTEQVEDAAEAMEIARDIDPSHPRLAFLDAQVARERERLKLAQSQEIRGRINTLLAKAVTLTNQGKLVTPAGGSARDALLEARRLDPTNPEVARALTDLSQAVADEASRSTKVATSDVPQPAPNRPPQVSSADSSATAAEAAQPSARNNNPANRQSRVTPLLKQPRASAPTSNQPNDTGTELVANIRRMLNEGKLIEPKGDNAKDALTALRATAPARAEINELANTLSSRLLESGKQALAAKELDRSQQLLTAARDVGAPANENGISQAERDLAQARAGTNGNANLNVSSIVPASTLTRVKMVEPIYPAAARRRNEKGVVEVLFTVTPSGSVEGVEVRKSNPARVFDDAAIKAVEQWLFEPVQVNGQAVPQRAVVRLMFSMD